ncbi:MAG: DNA primase [Candidatus Zixiibacteriota bacterium]
MAGHFSPELLDQIRDANDVVDLISEYVPLKKRGKNFVGLCPFHSEKQPSFTVTPDKQIFYCFGCGEGGNVISFLMKHDKLSFPEAVKVLGKRASIPLPEKSFDAKRAKQLDRLYYANQVANEYFLKNLYRERPGKRARQYLKKRGFDSDTQKLFSLGFAPLEWEGLVNFARTKGIEPETLNQAGLAAPRTQASGYYDRFRNRITFPVFNLSRKIVGFGGRVLDDKDEPKYLNSPETPIYHKGKILYGLNLSKDEIRQKESAILVEGNIDVISLYQARIKNVVASSGTAFTQNQARLLSRYAEKVFLFFDADTAGQSATFRSVDLLFSEGLEVFVVSLKQGEDPDSYVQKFGPDAVTEEIQKAKSFIDFKYESLGRDFEELSMKEQEKVIRDLAETAGKITDEIRRNLFIKKIAQTLKIDEKPVRRLVDRKKPSAGGGRRTVDGGHPGEASLSREEEIEKGLLRILMEDRKLLKLTTGKLDPDDFSNSEHKEIFQLIKAEKKTSPAVLLDKTENEKTKDLILRISGIDLGPAEFSVQLTDHLTTLARLKKNRKVTALKDEIQAALQKGDTETANRLTKEFEKLKRT